MTIKYFSGKRISLCTNILNRCCVLLFIHLLSIHPSIHPSVHPSICLSICLPACLSVYLSVCLSVCLSLCLSLCPSVFPSVRPSVFPSVRLSVQLSVRPSVSQSFPVFHQLLVFSCYSCQFTASSEVKFFCFITLSTSFFRLYFGSSSRYQVIIQLGHLLSSMLIIHRVYYSTNLLST